MREECAYCYWAARSSPLRRRGGPIPGAVRVAGLAVAAAQVELPIEGTERDRVRPRFAYRTIELVGRRVAAVLPRICRTLVERR